MQSLNIYFIVITSEESNLDKSILIILFKPLNICSQLFIEVLNFIVILLFWDWKIYFFFASVSATPFTITWYGEIIKLLFKIYCSPSIFVVIVISVS